MEQCHSRGFVNTAALGFDNTVFDLVAHAETVTAADAVGFEHQFNLVVVFLAVKSNRNALFETNGDFLRLDVDVFFPERNTHDRFNDLHAAVKVFEVFGFVGSTEHVGVSGISLFLAHLVAETVVSQELAHFSTAAEFCDELNVKPGLVNLEVGIGD